MSRLPPVEEDDGKHSRQQVMTTARVAGESMAKYARTHLSAKRKAADFIISESRLSRIKEDDASQSRQKDMPMASVAGKARVDVLATISDKWRALMVKMDAVRRFRSSLARFRSRKAKSKELLIDDPSTSEDWHSDDKDTFRLDHWLSVSVDWKTEDKISRWLAGSQVDLKRMGEGYGFIDLRHPFRGVRALVKGYSVEIRPMCWKQTIWLGTYKTAHEAARAYDAGIFYTRKKIDLMNFHDSVTSFVAIPPVSLEEARKSVSSREEFMVFIKEQARKAATRASHDPEWKRTYYIQEKPVHSSARKGKNQNQETSGFKSPSYPRSEDWYSDDNDTFRSDDWLSVSVDWETEDEILRSDDRLSVSVDWETEDEKLRIGFFPDFPCTTDAHHKQENQFSTIGISDTTQNCFPNGLHEIFMKGRKGKFEGADAIEFLFNQAEDMSKVVGVGLQWSKVVVTKQFGVVVKHIGEHSWFDLWTETSFSPLRIPILKPPTKLSTCNFTAEESSKRFGVGVGGSRFQSHCMYVEHNEKQTGEMFPLIVELAEKMGLSENAKDSNFQHPSGISSEAMEGEKNDHGGPLLETMDGGETNQGGTSSEPMDSTDVGESSQGGNSGEPMEGVESGQGGPSSGPMEVGGDQQSSDFQLRFESLQAKGPQDSNENKSLTVTVIPEAGGTFYERSSDRQVHRIDLDPQIRDVAIAPWFKFKFEILGGERKITTITETACDLDGAQLQLHEDWNSGYCHDNITISLTCLDPQAVRVSPGTVVAMDVMKRSMTETYTGSTSRANQVSGQASVQVQIPVVPIGIQTQGTLGVTDTNADSRARAVTTESSDTQFGGFYVNQIGGAWSLAFNFLYPKNIDDVMTSGERQFIHAGISKTLRPSIIGEWIPLDTADACLYTFKTYRNIYSIRSVRRWMERREEGFFFLKQKYEMPFLINHAMSHIHCHKDTELRGPGLKILDKVLEKWPKM
ncbi:hypothetical protein BDL97_01G041100 [Sphagnum fallax]|nr:hypothetical protein BDL97_01G041100 [Sphagnum fallax]